MAKSLIINQIKTYELENESQKLENGEYPLFSYHTFTQFRNAGLKALILFECALEEQSGNKNINNISNPLHFKI
jgi:hypothetical protein